MSERNLSANILRSVSLGHALTDVYWVIFPALLPLIQKEFALSYARAGLLITSFIVIAGLGSFITGYLGDRLGRRIILSAGFLISSLALILCARSNFYWELLLTSLLLGAGASTFHPNSIALLMNLFSERRGRVLGIFTLSGFMGVAVMLAVVSYLAGIMLSWRQIVFIFAWPGLIFAPFLFRSLSFSTEKKREQNKAELKSTRLSQNVIFLLIVFFAANLALTISFNGVYFFIPTFMVHAKDIALERANYFYILVAVGGMIGSFFSGKLVDRFSSLPVILITTVIAIPIIFLLTLATNYISLALILVLFGVSFASIFPAQGVYLALISTYSLGKTYGLIQCLTILVGAAAPGIIGLLADRLGLVTALQLGTIPLILAGILFIYLRAHTSLQNSSS